MPATTGTQEIKDHLASDEFVISVDTSSHLIQGKGNQFSLTPAHLFLTNRHIFVSPTVQNIDLVTIQLAEITNMNIHEMNDCLLLTIQADDEINIFIPDPEQQHAFMEIVTKLVAALSNGQIDCDSLALSLQRRFIESESTTAFYQTVSANKDNLVEQPPVDQLDSPYEMLNHINPTPIRLLDVVVNLLNLGDFFVFSIFTTIVLLLSVLFYFVPFGVVVCGVTSSVITRKGFQMIFSKRPRNKKNKHHTTKNPQLQSYIKSYETFTEAFKKRILWRNPRATLETVIFLLSTATMFVFYDPAFVLMISMFGLSFVERWNPFGFGSLQEIISNLFTLS